jgi:hypothetical protein
MRVTIDTDDTTRIDEPAAAATGHVAQAPAAPVGEATFDGGPSRANDETAPTEETDAIDAGPPSAELIAAIAAAGGVAAPPSESVEALDAGAAPSS